MVIRWCKVAWYDARPPGMDILDWVFSRGVRVNGCLVLPGQQRTYPYVCDEAKRTVRLTRYVFQRVHHALDPGEQVLHHCDNPPCFDPEHLFAGTIADNMRDMMAKGRRQYRRGTAHAQAKLTAEQRTEIKRRYLAGGVRQTDLAHEFDVGQAFISRVVRADAVT